MSVRLLSYVSTCCDSISKRRQFMYALMVTTILEIVMFTVMNVSLFDGTTETVIFDILLDWGLGRGV